MASSKYLKYSITLILITIGLSILPHLGLKSFWSLDSVYLPYITLFEGLCTFIILPILLLKIYRVANKKLVLGIPTYHIVSLFMIIVAISLSDYYHFKNFSDMTGTGEDPDYGTKILRYILLIGGFIIALIGIGIQFFKDRQKKNP